MPRLRLLELRLRLEMLRRQLGLRLRCRLLQLELLWQGLQLCPLCLLRRLRRPPRLW